MIASAIVNPMHKSYLYIGQEIIDFSDERLPRVVAKVVKQFVECLPATVFLLTAPRKLSLFCIAVFIYNQNLGCEDKTCAKIITTLSCVCFFKALVNIYTFSLAPNLHSFTISVIELALGSVCQQILPLLDQDSIV